MSQSDPLTVTSRTLAEAFRLTRRQVERLARDGVVTRVSRGRYDLVQSVRGFLAHSLAGQSAAHEPADLAEARRALLSEQARKLRRENELGDGSVLKREDVQFVINTGTVAIVGQLEALPGRTAGPLAGMNEPARIRAYLMAEVRHTRRIMAEKFAALGNLAEEMLEDCPLCGGKMPDAD